MSVDVVTEIIIRRPREQVASYASNPNNAPQWHVNIKSVDWKSAPPLRVGSRLAFVAQFLGRQLTYSYEIVELLPSERLVMRTSEGPFAMETSYTWETITDGSTRMILRNRGNPTGFAKLVAPLKARAMRKANQRDLARLKSILEQR